MSRPRQHQSRPPAAAVIDLRPASALPSFSLFTLLAVTAAALILL